MTRRLVALLAVGVFVSHLSAPAQELDYSEILSPVELPPPVELQPRDGHPAVLTGGETEPDEDDIKPVSSHQRMVITGQVQTLQEAMEAEKDTVDWYAWYMACREYLSRTGGLQCELGTPIKFHKNGRIEALTTEPRCIYSTAWRKFALPRQTRLEAIILPVRNGEAPPASPNEIYSRIEAYEKLQQQKRR